MVQNLTPKSSKLLFVLFLAVTGFAEAHAADLSPEELAARVKPVLERECARCHANYVDSSGAARVGQKVGVYGNLLDVKHLINRGYVIPGNHAGSPLWQVLNGQMPKPDEINNGQKLSQGDRDLIAKWIDSGAKDFNRNSNPNLVRMTADEVANLIFNDVRRESASERQQVRYLVMHNQLFGDQIFDDIALRHSAINKLINSLSWERQIIRAKPLGPNQTILKIKLSDYGWTAKQWEILTKAHPYDQLWNQETVNQIALETKSNFPIIDGDWLVTYASQPPMYDMLLKLPKTIDDLEDYLQVDFVNNIRDSKAIRAGFTDSGVSKNNRIIERHQAAYGAYWISYDFASSEGKQNIFEFPIGPKFVTKHPKAFEEAGGEAIFNLPNGMQAYMLVDHNGKKISNAPPAIVQDRNSLDGSVVNGLSCMGCHFQGMIRKFDQVRKTYTLSSGKEPLLQEQVLKMYAEDAELKAVFDEDQKVFYRAIVKAGVDPRLPDPINQVFQAYHRSMSASEVLAELHRSPTDEAMALLRRVAADRRTYPTNVTQTARILIAPGGVIKRQNFENYDYFIGLSDALTQEEKKGR